MVVLMRWYLRLRLRRLERLMRDEFDARLCVKIDAHRAAIEALEALR